jgi:hypothetical protein
MVILLVIEIVLMFLTVYLEEVVVVLIILNISIVVKISLNTIHVEVHKKTMYYVLKKLLKIAMMLIVLKLVVQMRAHIVKKYVIVNMDILG